MANTYKILGQNRYAAGSSTTYETAYTVPTSTSAVISTIALCNTTPSAYTVRLCVVPSGGTPSANNALMYDTSIPANTIVPLTIGITLATGDSIRLASPMSGWITTHVFGSEIA